MNVITWHPKTRLHHERTLLEQPAYERAGDGRHARLDRHDHGGPATAGITLAAHRADESESRCLIVGSGIA